MSNERQSLEFESVPTVNWCIGPLPRLRLLGFLSRLFGRRGVPAEQQSARASPALALDTSVWLEAVPTIPGVRLRLPPGLQPRAIGDPPSGVTGDVLVGLWEDGERSLALWIGGEPDFPESVYSLGQWPVLEERTEAREQVSGGELTITAFRVSVRSERSHYGVGAYWHLDGGRWMRALADARTRREQEEFLAALRTIEISGEPR
jgi:hypothetical protein